MPAQPNLFTPARLGPVTLRNRIIKSATFEASTPNALVSDDLITYHRLPAAGGVGMTTVAYLAVSPEGRTDFDQIWWRPEAIPGLRKLTDTIHAEGAAISAQIGNAGPLAHFRTYRGRAIAPSGRSTLPGSNSQNGRRVTTSTG
jgi:2,4-dienoyl-CoA reductase-like NADH-dependent reductase (Old Yellow Enzyme family)